MSAIFAKKSYSQDELYEKGLILEGTVYPPEGDLKKDGVSLNFLVDTGASISGLSEDVINDLNLPLTSYEDIGSADGTNTHSCHMGQIIIEPQPLIEDASVLRRFIKVDLSGQSDYQGLLGRDVLINRFFNYEGFSGDCIVSM